jgi:hypothetical protein
MDIRLEEENHDLLIVTKVNNLGRPYRDLELGENLVNLYELVGDWKDGSFDRLLNLRGDVEGRMLYVRR